MKYKYEFIFVFLLFITVMLAVILYSFGVHSAVLNPKGIVALREKNLMINALNLMLIVVIPVLLLTFFTCVRYRATNKKAKYTPDWCHSYLAETIWWGFPFIIIAILSYMTWTSSHELDPWKKIDSTIKPLKIQVVALQWKWLFLYPEQQIASVNFFQFPEKTPLDFDITSDAPMNSFWVPQLGGQVYAMPGMRSQLHLIADESGSYRGSSANLSGEGFAGMTFTAKASSEEDFNKWVDSVKNSKESLNREVYDQLAKPSEYLPVTTYSLKDLDLFDHIVMKYMAPPTRK